MRIVEFDGYNFQELDRAGVVHRGFGVTTQVYDSELRQWVKINKGDLICSRGRVGEPRKIYHRA